MSERKNPETGPEESDSTDPRRSADDPSGRDESPPSDSSRPSSVGGYLADEIGALDSMRHEKKGEGDAPEDTPDEDLP